VTDGIKVVTTGERKTIRAGRPSGQKSVFFIEKRFFGMAVFLCPFKRAFWLAKTGKK